jgi:hypothetical protein
LNLLQKLVGRSVLPPKVSVVDAKTFTGRRRHLEVSGEFYHQSAIRKVLGGEAREGVRFLTVATLLPNPQHNKDKNAVEVLIDGQLVGYLSREQAVGYHNAMAEAGHQGRGLGNVEARIFGRPLDADNHGGFGVAIYLPQSIAEKIGYGVHWRDRQAAQE